MPQTADPAARAAIVFEQGWVFTGSSESPSFGGLALGHDGRILTCEAQAVADLARTAAQRIDLGGRLLMPGFQDAHAHPVVAGMEMLGCDLSDTGSAAEAFAAIRAYADAHHDLPWITGAGWSKDAFAGGAPTRQMLDAIVPDRPVLLEDRDHHSAWANTAAFEAAGIDARTPDPADGRCERERDGTPAGTVHDGAVFLFDRVRPVPTPDLAYAGLLAGQERLLSFGVTAWQDAAIGTLMGMPDTMPVYLRALEAGTLHARVRGAQWWNRTDGLEQLPRMLERRDETAERCDPERFSLGTAKVMVDGVAESRTAAMHGRYRDAHGAETASSGISFFASAELAGFVAALDAAGMQVHFHALGDRAVTDALDALEHARHVNGPTGLRHHLAHLEVVAAADVPRFARLGATANLQALWAAHDEQLDRLVLPFLPEGTANRLYPFGDLAAAGAELAGGSDWPVSTPDPIQAIHVAVQRSRPGSERSPLGPASQRLTPAQIVTAYTRGSARVNHLDHATGALAPGYHGDLAILDRNLFELPGEDLHTARVDETWIGGRRVFTR